MAGVQLVQQYFNKYYCRCNCITQNTWYKFHHSGTAYNLKFEGKIRDQLDKIFAEELNYPAYKELQPDKAKFGYKVVILLLGGVALLATWLDFLIK